MSFPSRIPRFYALLVLVFTLFLEIRLSKGLDTIISGQSLSGNQTIVSKNGTFELCFFTPGKSRNYYIGIRYASLPEPFKTVIWVGNRNQPISEPFSSSELKLLPDGNLVLLDQSKTLVWSSNSSSKMSNATYTALLLDNGNLVIRDDTDSPNVIWQSFDYPTDTWLPGGKVGYNKLRNEDISLSPWRSSENPAVSLFSLDVQRNGTSHLLLWNKSKEYWSSGEWDGKIFKFVPEIALDYYIKNVTIVTNENETYFTYEAGFPNVLTRFMIDTSGQLKQFVWRKDSIMWQIFWTRPPQQCEVYGFCGDFSSCNQLEPPLCNCLQGFEPKVPKNWELDDHSDGCVRKTPLKCNKGGNDAFTTMPNTNFPVDAEPISVESVEACKLACFGNCSCTGYAYNDSGCYIWKGHMFNLQQLSSDDVTRTNFYVRVAVSDVVAPPPMVRAGSTPRPNKKTIWIAVGAIGGFFALFFLVLGIIWRRRWTEYTLKVVEDSLMLFKFQDLKIVTKNFSEKLGEGGFGAVFKGTLPNSTAIAVKRLNDPIQGERQDKQFRAEVSTIGTIQHINLVRLRGFCVQGTERFLVYDYMPNSSLETHLFRKDSRFLDWKTRFNIAIGTARGLAYLHEKCRDCIIHCDIKPENILLDAEYNPKVGDFGLAKLIGREFSRVLTTVRGTRGYLAPEWISGDAVTAKADVFSFGMLLFEIISGRRNRDTYDDGSHDYFPARVANQVNESDDVMDLLDPKLEGDADKEEVIRACKVACWCIQDDEEIRPSMGQVVQILEGVSEVNIPPVPRFLQGLSENAMDSIVYQETPSN